MLQLAEKARRNTCFMDMGCKDSDEDCQRLCRFRSCEREDDSLCDRIPEKLCRTNCIIKSKCKEDDEHCIKVSIFRQFVSCILCNLLCSEYFWLCARTLNSSPPRPSIYYRIFLDVSIQMLRG